MLGGRFRFADRHFPGISPSPRLARLLAKKFSPIKIIPMAGKKQVRKWDQVVRRTAEPERARHYAQILIEKGAGEAFGSFSEEQARVLGQVFSGSRAMSELLVAHPEWLNVLEIESLRFGRQAQGLRREVNSWADELLGARDYAGVLGRLREFKQREMLRITARDLGRLGSLSQITREISDLADVCLETVFRACLQQLNERFGLPYTEEITGDWEPATFCILGMGKLGGQELNYSSDIDVLFVYSGEGDVFREPRLALQTGSKPRATLANHQFFSRLSESIIAEVSRLTAEGTLFRIDLRLRPEGKSGPLARSLASYENYYAQWGQTWERMMLIKARPVAGDKGLGAEFLEMVQPFRHPRAISEEMPREVAEMKQRIEKEVVRSGEIERNVKLGRGGIREIEFVAQTFQVLHAGRAPFLQIPQTLAALAKLADYHLIERADALKLEKAYVFLRDVEHRLQMEDNQQTHTIPLDKDFQRRLAALMDFKNLDEFERALVQHRNNVRAVYDSVINADGVREEDALPKDVAQHAAEWQEILRSHRFRDCVKGWQLVKEFVHGPGYSHVSARTSELAVQLIGRVLSMCGDRQRSGQSTAQEEPGTSSPRLLPELLSDPDRVMARLDSYVANYGARALLYETWVSNAPVFKLLLLLLDRSEFLAELAIRSPDLIDEIEQSGRLRRKRNTDQILQDLRKGGQDEDQRRWLRRYFHAEQMRIGLRDILDLARAEETQAEITALADAYLIYGLEVVMRRNKIKEAPFAIFALGKLGGEELIYASDLDIIFVAADKTAHLPKLQKYATELMDLLSARTENGSTFATDARLRPDGEKGLIANTLKAYEEYYTRRAGLWELQALSRWRFVTGDKSVEGQFSKLVSRLTNFSAGNPGVSGWSADWKERINDMRMRIEKERTPVGKNDLAIKTGTGGLMDAEFLAQALCLAHGWHEPNTLRALERARREGVLSRQSAEIAVERYRWLMSVERILRRWSFEPESVLPDDPAPLYRVSVRCGFAAPLEFLEAVARARREMREAYLAYFRAG